MAEAIFMEGMEDSYKIVNCREFGDYVIAEQIFEEGETVFKEETLLSSPLEHQIGQGEPKACCVGCYKIIPSITKSCSKCCFPVCSDICSQNEFHKNLECGILAENRIEQNQSTFGFLKYLRVILSKKVYPKRYGKFKFLMQKRNPKIMGSFLNGYQESLLIWNFLTEECHLEVTLFEVRQVWLALKFNSFILSAEDNADTRYRGFAVFTLGCKLSHSCNPNLEWFFSKTEAENGTVKWFLQMHATRKIEKGEVLSIAYTPLGLNYGTEFRRKKYQSLLPFSCLCPRCLSPTEEGTNFSSPKCPNCMGGYIIPEEPLSSLTCIWRCSHCPFSKDGVDVETSVIKQTIVVAAFMNKKPSSLDRLDKFLDKNSGTTLHPNHFIIFQATVYWFLNSDWNARLMKQDDNSLDLYDKILTRFNRCIPLVQKFLPTMTIVEMEAILAAAIAAFAFKSDDCVTINFNITNRQLKIRFCKMIVSHLSRANFWMQRQPCYQGREERKAAVADIHDKWSRRLEIYEQEFLHHEAVMQTVP